MTDVDEPEDDPDCATCGHSKDDHLVRIAIPDNVYGRCGDPDCDCTDYEPEEVAT